ncbi:hypothetical protein [Bradyrhizobium sp.]
MRREKEIGTTLSDEEKALIDRAVKARNTKLATYVRERLVECARRDLAEHEPPPSTGALTDEQKRELAAEVANMALEIMSQRFRPEKKSQAENSA